MFPFGDISTGVSLLEGLTSYYAPNARYENALSIPQKASQPKQIGCEAFFCCLNAYPVVGD
jgi:hypothetical protein